MMRGSSLLGILFMAGFIASALVLFTGLGYLPDLVPAAPGPRWIGLGLSGVLALVFYGLALLDGVRRER
jgi:hypothetical protein